MSSRPTESLSLPAAPSPCVRAETEPGAYRLTLSYDGRQALTESLSSDGWEFIVRRFDFSTGERTALALPLEAYAAVRANDDGRTVLAERREDRGVEIVHVYTGQRGGHAPWANLRGGLCPLGKAEVVAERLDDGASALVCRGADGVTYWSSNFPSSVRLLEAYWAGLVFVVAPFVDDAPIPALKDADGNPLARGILVIDAPTGRVHRVLGVAGDVRVVPSPDGLRALLHAPSGVATYGAGAATGAFVDLIHGRLLERPELVGTSILAAAFSPRGEILITVDDTHRVDVWIDDARARAASFVAPAPIVGRVSLGFSGDGNRFALTDAAGDALFVWEVDALLPDIEPRSRAFS